MERKTENKLTVIFFFAEFGEILHWKMKKFEEMKDIFVKGFLIWIFYSNMDLQLIDSNS